MRQRVSRETDNLKKTFELIDLTVKLAVAGIMADSPEISESGAEKIFWRRIRTIKDKMTARYNSER